MIFGEAAPVAQAKAAVEAYIPYIERELAHGTRLASITRHMLGLFRGVPGARAFRRLLATEAVKPGAGVGGAHRGAGAGDRHARRSGAHRGVMFGIPIGELLFLAAVIVAGGIVTGILAGLFGIGGGAIIVPVLYEVFRVLGVPEEVRMQLCVGTSMAIIVPTNVRSYLVHRRYGAVLMDVVRAWALPVRGRRRRRGADCRPRAGRGPQDRVCRHHRHHRTEAPDRPRRLADRECACRAASP